MTEKRNVYENANGKRGRLHFTEVDTLIREDKDLGDQYEML